MKHTVNCLARLLVIASLLPINIAFAQTDSNALPLSAADVTKLQKLLGTQSTSNAVPIFQTAPPHEHVIWNQTPITVILPIGKERMLNFPDTVAFGYDKSALPDSVLRVQNNNGVLYLTAKKSFDTQRTEVKLSDTGKIILLNLSAQTDADDVPLDVILASENNNAPSANNASHTDTTTPMDAVTLTRFAVQQLYAPKRLLTQPPAIYRTPMRTHKTVPLLLDGSVMAMPLASWRGGDLFVTAVLMRNQEQQAITLDPRDLCGTWQTATFYPQTVLAPAGNQADGTTLFVVSTRPFADSVNTCG